MCRKVQITLQGWSFTTDFIVLELGNIDVILGMYWLRTLGKCEIDWEKHEYTFMYQGKQVTLTGDPSLHSPMKSLKTIQPSSEVPVQLNELLNQFVHVSKEPTELPLVRGKEHGITLQPGLGPISVKPYRLQRQTWHIILCRR